MYIKELLLEAVYGNMAIVYHRTDSQDIIDKIYDSGFKPGIGDMYGKGLYATYDLQSQLEGGMSETYGDYIIKFAIPIDNFLILDFNIFSKTKLVKLFNSTQQSYINDQFKYFKMNNFITKYDNIKFTSDIALQIYNKHGNRLLEKINGMIFTDDRHGKVLVCYNTSLPKPLSLSSDNGQTFIPYTEKLRQFIKTQSNQSNSNPLFDLLKKLYDLSRKPSTSNGFDNKSNKIKALKLLQKYNINAAKISDVIKDHLPNIDHYKKYFNMINTILRNGYDDGIIPPEAKPIMPSYYYDIYYNIVINKIEPDVHFDILFHNFFRYDQNQYNNLLTKIHEYLLNISSNISDPYDFDNPYTENYSSSLNEFNRLVINYNKTFNTVFPISKKVLYDMYRVLYNHEDEYDTNQLLQFYPD